jgi:uncharacterized protein (TIGR03437 family)
MLAKHEATSFIRGRRSLWAFGLGGLLMIAALSLASANRAAVSHAAKTEAGQSNQPRIIVAGTTLTAEPCASPDGIIDPGETVTVSFALQNTGTANTSQQLRATLLATGGVTAPSAPQNYGALAAGGFAVARDFSFTAAAGNIGSTLTATFQLQDGNINRGTVSVSFTLGVMTITNNPGVCYASFPPPDQRSPAGECAVMHCQTTARPPFPVGRYLLNCVTQVGTRLFYEVHVLDREPPRLTCPANITRTTDANQCAATINPSTATASDNCGASLTVEGTRSDNQPLTATYPLGTTTITWQATDAAGNQAACQQTITVTANSAALTCPANISVPATSGAGRTVTYPLPTASDACSSGATVCNPASGSTFPIGTTTVTCQRSSTGQMASCAFTVNVIGNVVANVSAASFVGTELASESIVSAFGQRLATAIQAATTLPLPTTLAGTQVLVKDSVGVERAAQLFFVSPNQINYQVPPGTAPGTATAIVTSGDGTVSAETVRLASVAPGLFTADASGRGLAAATVLRVKGDGSQSFEPVASFDAAQNKFVAAPIDLGPASDQVFLVLYGSGWRFRSSLAAVTAKIGGADATVSFAGAVPNFVGLDQANLLIPRSLIGRGEVEVMLTVDGKTANTARINIK